MIILFQIPEFHCLCLREIFCLYQEIIATSSMAEPYRTDISLKAEKDLQAPSTSLAGSTGNTSFGCGKSRRNLTEVNSISNSNRNPQLLLSRRPYIACVFIYIILIFVFNAVQTEKEERRMRRILANRESARQTIRRRQVM